MPDVFSMHDVHDVAAHAHDLISIHQAVNPSVLTPELNRAR